MADKTAKELDELSIEESFEKLDQMLEKLEDREVPLEEALSLYQEGMKLLARCNERIDRAEKQILIMNGDGTLEEFH